MAHTCDKCQESFDKGGSGGWKDVCVSVKGGKRALFQAETLDD
ncbi:hypothetical protein GCM10025857_20360 [Alicyclobacillus contaminans]|nr:hypothetical protein GCM10025857_20360 [Alicyclobacillus contaminans]